MQKFKKVIAMLIIACVGCFVLSACNNNVVDEVPANCVHEWEDVTSDYNRTATYEEAGRQLRKCKKCGTSAGFVLPKLEYASGTTAPDYLPLLEVYIVRYGDTLEEITAKYFTSGWTFVSDSETVGEPTSEGREFKVVFNSEFGDYTAVSATIKLIVQKAIITADDILIETAPKILLTDTTLADVSITVKASSPIRGVVEWVSGQTILRAQSAEYSYVFYPTESDLYDPYYGKVTLPAE